MTQAWSWLLTVTGLVTLWAIGNKKPWGMATGMVSQLLWITYALVTRQYGFIVSSSVYAVVYARNYKKWKDHREPEHPEVRALQHQGRAALRRISPF